MKLLSRVHRKFIDLPLRTKLVACVLSAAFMGAAGAFYVQVFQYIDPAIAFGPTTSVEALLGAIVGGMGTLWGPVLGALALHVLSDLTRNLFGALPWAAPTPGTLMATIFIGVLPILLGISMWLQQKLNPAPADAARAISSQIRNCARQKRTRLQSRPAP